MVNSSKLKARMVELGLTQKDVGDAIHLAPSTVSQKLNGARSMYLDEAFKLAEILKIAPEDFRLYFFIR